MNSLKLHDDLFNLGQPTGGTWYYHAAFGAASNPMVVNITGVGQVSIAVGDAIPGGFNPEVDFTGNAAAFGYQLRYEWNTSCGTAEAFAIVEGQSCVDDCTANNLSISVTAGLSEFNFGPLLSGAVEVTDYVIDWVHVESGDLVLTSGRGVNFDPNTMESHPYTTGYPVKSGFIQPIIRSSSVGNNLDCLPTTLVEPIDCASGYFKSYSGSGGVAASHSVNIEVDGSTDNLLVLFETQSIPDSIKVEYNSTTPLLEEINLITYSDDFTYRIPINHVAGADLATITISNSDPTKETVWTLRALCCSETPCPIPYPNARVRTAGLNTRCGFSLSLMLPYRLGVSSTCPSFQTATADMCIGWTRESMSRNATYSGGGCTSTTVNSLGCNAFTGNLVVTKSGDIYDFVYSNAGDYSNAKAFFNQTQFWTYGHYIEYFPKDFGCGPSDVGNTGYYRFAPSVHPITFNDGARTITVDRTAGNPFTDDCTTCEVQLKTAMNVHSGTSGTYSHSSGRFARATNQPVENNVVYTERYENECGSTVKYYKLKFTDESDLENSWQWWLSDNTGAEITLLEEAGTWTPLIC